MRICSGLVLAAAMLAIAGTAQADVKAGVEAWQSGDFGRAVSEWRADAEKGDADAQFNLGQAYKLGQGVQKNLTVASDWYKKAAAQGHEQAQATLGLIMFQNGDRTGAMPWIQKAAAAGEPRAQYIYGTALFNGDIVSRDWPQAYAMMSRSAASGLPQARSSLTVMEQRLSASEKTRGSELARALPALATSVVLAPDWGTAPARGAPRVAGTALASAQLPATPAQSSPKAASKASAAQPKESPQRPAPAKAAAKPAEPKTAVQPAEPKAAAKPAAPKAAANTAAPARQGGPWRIQLGAFSSADAARAAWRNAGASGLTPSYSAAGKLTRLQAGGFPSREAAARACTSLRRASGCLVVKP